MKIYAVTLYLIGIRVLFSVTAFNKHALYGNIYNLQLPEIPACSTNITCSAFIFYSSFEYRHVFLSVLEARNDV